MKHLKNNCKPSDFLKGQIYKMEVAQRSHVKSPYYVVIDDVGADFIRTMIPGEHTLTIKYPSDEWDYHIPRMELIGTDDDSMKLIYNQDNLYHG